MRIFMNRKEYLNPFWFEHFLILRQLIQICFNENTWTFIFWLYALIKYWEDESLYGYKIGIVNLNIIFLIIEVRTLIWEIWFIQFENFEIFDLRYLIRDIWFERVDLTIFIWIIRETWFREFDLRSFIWKIWKVLLDRFEKFDWIVLI